MGTRDKHILSIVMVLILVVGAAAMIYFKPPRLGLDLQGGMNVILTAKAKPGSPVTAKKMDQALFVITNRINKLGVAEPEISRQGDKNILIQLPGITNTQKALDVIGKTALLEFRPLLPKYESYTEEQLNKAITQKKKVFGDTLLTGDALSSAKAGFDQNNKPEVDIKFTKEGGKKFADITTRYIKKRLAIVLDGKVMSAPVVQNRIPDGAAVISGKFTIEEVKTLVLVLETGALPVALDISENRAVGPTLGRESLFEGLRAGIFGFILVALFMIIFYRAYGLITCVSLSFFTVLLVGLIATVNVILTQAGTAGFSMTLPGIAGIILMIGIAGDSSIIVFERIKEEIRGGKTSRVSMISGYQHGLITFVDADLVTLATAVVLFYFGIGPVRGFAFTLMLGILCDLFTSYFFVRPTLGLLSTTSLFSNSRMIGVRTVEG